MIAVDLRAEARRHMPPLSTPAGLRDAAIRTWRGRMSNEHQSAEVFEQLADQMSRAGYGTQAVAEVAGFAREERRHGVLCGAVVEALGGEARFELQERGRLPDHQDVSLDEAVLRNVLSIACLSETIAVSLIGAERAEMPDGPLRSLLTDIWADEVGHARFGWRLLGATLPGASPELRTRLSAYLRIALRHLEQHELAHLPDRAGFGAGAEQLGLCSGRDARTLFYATVERVIVPRLSDLGLRAAAAWSQRHATRRVPSAA